MRVLYFQYVFRDNLCLCIQRMEIDYNQLHEPIIEIIVSITLDICGLFFVWNLEISRSDSRRAVAASGAREGLGSPRPPGGKGLRVGEIEVPLRVFRGWKHHKTLPKHVYCLKRVSGSTFGSSTTYFS